MKLTFTDLISLAKEGTGLTDALSVTRMKRDINIGASKFMALLGREFNRKSRVTNLVSGQQYYQFPEDGHKLKEVIATIGTLLQPLEQIPTETAWRRMNIYQSTGQPTHYFIRGYDEVGLYPIPSATVTNGLELVFSPRHVEMTQDDYTTGTITVTENSQTITHSATGFTESMVGQWLQVTDGTDSNWYRISGYTNTSTLTIENYYQGASGSGKTFRIGQVADIPEEYHESLADFACFMHFLKRGDKIKADAFGSMFKMSYDLAKEEYGQATDNQVISAEPEYRTYNPFRGDPPASITL